MYIFHTGCLKITRRLLRIKLQRKKYKVYKYNNDISLSFQLILNNFILGSIITKIFKENIFAQRK